MKQSGTACVVVRHSCRFRAGCSTGSGSMDHLKNKGLITQTKCQIHATLVPEFLCALFPLIPVLLSVCCLFCLQFGAVCVCTAQDPNPNLRLMTTFLPLLFYHWSLPYLPHLQNGERCPHAGSCIVVSFLVITTVSPWMFVKRFEDENCQRRAWDDYYKLTNKFQCVFDCQVIQKGITSPSLSSKKKSWQSASC